MLDRTAAARGEMMGRVFRRGRRTLDGNRGTERSFRWPEDARAAVSFSFDDARPSQLTRGVPLLERLEVPATFFVLPGVVAAEREDWLRVIGLGHEIGNHTCSHPCGGVVSSSGSYAGPDSAWGASDALHALTLTDMRRELVSANNTLRELLGVVPSVFAYPCGQTSIGRGADTQSYVPLVAELFSAGRTFNDRWANSPAICDLSQIACVSCDGVTFSQLEPYFEAARANGGWLVLGGHDVGDSAGLSRTAAKTLEDAVGWCRRGRVWIDMVGTVSGYVSAVRREPALAGVATGSASRR